ncbi:polysaccharide lyase [Glaciecola petra]|uniref:Polysaccharide lyase 14 domain-containing protein n=1 Tax=Glaciecola petra TaxID=3075602 RepID=A0ABU2ZQJ1_9ALTE|nr:hypothetical protein [Aestuariibacter sp. P117]MDT0594901.1 hypothetical protein [Aestuariibacter sp. P117]
MKSIVSYYFFTAIIASPGFATASSPEQSAVCESENAMLFESFDNKDSLAAKLIDREKNYSVSNGVMTIHYVGSERGSERNRAHIPLSRSVQQATLNFDVYFPEDFDFVLGGKLFGFAPENPVWGGQETKLDGWSSRIMWREGGRPVTYNYHQNRPGKYGEDSSPVGELSKIPRGEWLSLSIYLDAGTGNKDGRSEVWLNGKKVSELTGLSFYDKSKKALITTLALQTFFGGSSPKWAPKNEDGTYRNLSATVDNMGVTEGPCIRPQPIRDI